MNIKIKHFLLVIFTVFVGLVQAQTKSINTSNIDFRFADGKIYITYDIVNSAPNELYTITVSIFRENGGKLNAVSLSGDLIEINGGTGKTIIWEQRKDGYVLDEKIYISLAIAPKIGIPVVTHLLKSAVFPGWGDYKIRNGKYHFIYGVAGLSAIGASIYMNSQAQKNYTNYKNSFDYSKSNNLFDKAKQQQNLSYIFASTACLVWTIDLTSLYSKSNKVKKQITKENSKYYFEKSQQTNSFSSSLNAINTKLPYDLAMERGDKLLADFKLPEAKIAFEEGQKYENTETVRNKLVSINKLIEEEKNKKITYDLNITKGQELMALKQFKEAIVAFESASRIDPKEKYPLNKIDEINLILNQIENQKLYDVQMAQGLAFLSNGNFESANNFFKTALTYKPGDITAINKCKECDNATAIEEQRIIDIEYKQKMAQANSLLSSKRYDDAKDIYYQASQLKPASADASNKIEECNNAITKIEEGKKQKKYNELVSNARKAKSGNRLSEAKAYYLEAREVYPDESEPTTQIKIIDALINDNSVNNKENNLSMLYNKCKSSVFFVFTSDYENTSQGSGFFISESGYAVSNYHVFKGSYAGTARVYTEDGNNYKIEVIEKNEDKDYIIFKVLGKPNQKFPAVKIANSTPAIGESVFAIGNPEGFSQTLSNGIISGYREEEKYIQTTTPITHGSSGGPIFNAKGEVIGITTSGKQEGNLFFAINIKELNLWKYK